MVMSWALQARVTKSRVAKTREMQNRKARSPPVNLPTRMSATPGRTPGTFGTAQRFPARKTRNAANRDSTMQPLTPPPLPPVLRRGEDADPQQEEGTRAAAAPRLSSMGGVMLDIAEPELKQALRQVPEPQVVAEIEQEPEPVEQAPEPKQEAEPQEKEAEVEQAPEPVEQAPEPVEQATEPVEQAPEPQQEAEPQEEVFEIEQAPRQEPQQPEQEAETTKPEEAKSADDFLEFLKEARHSVSEQDSILKARQEQIDVLIEQQAAMDMQLEVTANRLSVHATPEKVKGVEEHASPADGSEDVAVPLFLDDDTGDTEMKLDDETADAVTSQEAPAAVPEPLQTEEPAQAEEPAEEVSPEEVSPTEPLESEADSAEAIPFAVPRIEEPAQAEAEVPFPVPFPVPTLDEPVEEADETKPTRKSSARKTSARKTHGGARSRHAKACRLLPGRRRMHTPPPTSPPAAKRSRTEFPAERLEDAVTPPQVDVVDKPKSVPKAKAKPKRKARKPKIAVTPENYDSVDESDEDIETPEGIFVDAVTPVDDSPASVGTLVMDTPAVLKWPKPKSKKAKKAARVADSPTEDQPVRKSVKKQSKKGKVEKQKKTQKSERAAEVVESVKPKTKKEKKVASKKRQKEKELAAKQKQKEVAAKQKEKEVAAKQKEKEVAAKKKTSAKKSKKPPASPSEEYDSFDDDDMESDDEVWDEIATPATDSPDSNASLVVETPEVVRTARKSFSKSKKSKSSKKKH